VKEIVNVARSEQLSTSLSFLIASQPPEAGMGFKKFSTSYPVILTTFDGTWWDAAQIYRYHFYTTPLAFRIRSYFFLDLGNCSYPYLDSGPFRMPDGPKKGP
jgi:hypothetical protein